MRYEIIKEYVRSLDLLINNYSNLCIVCVVDCIPNKQLCEIINSMNKKITVLLLNENKGISYAMNVGLE